MTGFLECKILNIFMIIYKVEINNKGDFLCIKIHIQKWNGLRTHI